ncbi:MAG: hypothetical protein ACLPTF_00770 [Steroidobacteraceae bacterium]
MRVRRPRSMVIRCCVIARTVAHSIRVHSRTNRLTKLYDTGQYTAAVDVTSGNTLYIAGNGRITIAKGGAGVYRKGGMLTNTSAGQIYCTLEKP